MSRRSCAVCVLPMICLALLPFAAPPAFAKEMQMPRCTAKQGSSEAVLTRHLDDIRSNDSFYRQLEEWKGPPSACKGSLGKGEFEGESRLELSWPDGSRLEQSSMLPETSIVRYSNPKGLVHADELIARLRTYAAEWGLQIDWNAPHPESEDGMRVIEYQDPDPGVNGFVRLSYDRQNRLVAVSLSVAL